MYSLYGRQCHHGQHQISSHSWAGESFQCGGHDFWKLGRSCTTPVLTTSPDRQTFMYSLFNRCLGQGQMQVKDGNLPAVSDAYTIQLHSLNSQHAPPHTFKFATYLARAGNSLNLAPRRTANIKFGPMAISAQNPMSSRPRSLAIVTFSVSGTWLLACTSSGIQLQTRICEKL